jgi:hypothetical protein
MGGLFSGGGGGSSSSSNATVYNTNNLVNKVNLSQQLNPTITSNINNALTNQVSNTVGITENLSTRTKLLDYSLLALVIISVIAIYIVISNLK